jgi:hypothetical protein
MKRALLVLSAVAACSSPNAPRLSGDLYTLVSIAGVPLPAPYAENPSLNQRIVADTIAFTSTTTGERRTVYEERSGIERTAFTYKLQNGNVEIAFKCPDTANCIAPPHMVGTLTFDDFRVTLSKVTRAPMTFGLLYPPD